MNTQSSVETKVPEEAVNLDLSASDAFTGKSLADMQEQIEKIASDKLRGLLEREAQLHEEIDKLSSLDNESERMKAAQAELMTVRADMAKRGEDLANLSYAIAAEMDRFGQLSGDSMQDRPEDIAMRSSAEKAIETARNALAQGHTDQKAAQTAMTEAEALMDLPWIFGKINNRSVKIADAKSDIVAAGLMIAESQQKLESAQSKLPEVEEQIQSNKHERMRESSLLETYQRISRWVTQAKDVLKGDIGEYQVALQDLKASLSSATERRVDASQRMRTAEENISTMERNFRDLKEEQKDITDKTDPSYQKLETKIGELGTKLDAENNEFRLAQSGFADAELAVKERRVSVDALTAQVELAKHQFNRFAIAEETARVVGHAIELMVKGSEREVINESLDKGTHKMTAAIYDLSKKGQVASIRQLNDMLARKIELSNLLDDMDKDTAEVLAAEGERHMEATAALRQTYREQGIDVENLSGLQAAADLAQKLSGVEPRPELKDDLF